MTVPFEQLIGKTQDHLTQLDKTPYLIHKEAKMDFLSLQRAAFEAGFDLSIVSSFRDYEKQKTIWNAKAQGQRALMDNDGKSLDYESLSSREILYAILRWSALPGASRHHWGTDIDVYDSNALPSPDYSIQLTPEEVADEGIFGPFHMWLDEKIATGNSFGFFRPYAKDLGGVAPERWHLSYRPASDVYFKNYTYEVFKKMIQDSKIILKELIIQESEKIFKEFVTNITQ